MRGGQVKQAAGLHRAVGQPAQRVHQWPAIGGRGGVDIDQDQVPMAEQFAAAAADMCIQAGRPGQALPRGELVDIALRRVLGHRQARGRERTRGDPGGSQHLGGTVALTRREPPTFLKDHCILSSV
jgi:hypothetical protein